MEDQTDLCEAAGKPVLVNQEPEAVCSKNFLWTSNNHAIP